MVPGPRAASGRQLLVDVSVIARGDARTGVQRVVRSLLRELLRAPPEGFAITPVAAGPWHRYRRAPRAFLAELGHPDARAGRRIDVGAGDVFLGLDLATYDIARRRRQLDRWKRDGATLVFVAYDLLPELRPEWFSDRAVKAYRGWLRDIAARADGVLCISRAVRGELAHWLQHHAPDRAPHIRLGWFHLGGDIAAHARGGGRPDAFEAQLAAMGARPSILMAGTLEPRKGHALALSAFERLWIAGRDVNLVIAGRAAWKVEALVARLRAHPEAGRRLLWIEDAGDDTLCAAYRAAAGLLVASEAEGFGLPIVEAAQFGKPILARDLPVFREVAGEHADYFSGAAPAAVADDIGAWLDRVRQGRAASSAALTRLTWEHSARMLREGLRSVLRAGESGT